MRLLLIEDDEALANALGGSLRLTGFVVDWAPTVAAANSWIDAEEYALVLLDLGLPDGDGADVVRRLRLNRNRTPVLVLSARESVDERVRLLNLGADDYLVKPATLDELEARVRALVRRSHGLAEPDLVVGRLRLDLAGHRAHVGDEPLDLSAREWAALQYLALRANRIVTKEQLMQALYGYDEAASLNAVEKTLSRLRPKLEALGVEIRTVRGLGYSLERPSGA